MVRAVAIDQEPSDADADEKITARIEHAKQTAAVAVESGSTITEIGTSTTILKIWQQGDASLYSDNALRERFALRNARCIAHVLEIWWETALQSEANDAGQETIRALRSGKLAAKVLTERGHALCFHPIYRALMDEYDEADAISAIQDDWTSDRRGENLLPKEFFLDSMFELADVWTRNIDESEYHDFLWMLLEHVTGVSREQLASGNAATGGLAFRRHEDVPGSTGAGLVFRSYDEVSRLVDVHAAKVERCPRLATTSMGCTNLDLPGISASGSNHAITDCNRRASDGPSQEQCTEDSIGRSARGTEAAHGPTAGTEPQEPSAGHGPKGISSDMIADHVMTPMQARAKESKRRRECATTLQAATRGFRDRKKGRKRKHAIPRMQAGVRGKQSRAIAATRQDAIDTIQAGGRGHGGRRAAGERRGAVEAIQTASRGLLGRAAASKRRRAVVTLQAGTRGLIGRDISRIIFEITNIDAERQEAHRQRVQGYAYDPSPTRLLLPTIQFKMARFPHVNSHLTVGVSLSRGMGRNSGLVVAGTWKNPNLNQKSRLFDFASKPSRLAEQRHQQPIWQSASGPQVRSHVTSRTYNSLPAVGHGHGPRHHPSPNRDSLIEHSRELLVPGEGRNRLSFVDPLLAPSAHPTSVTGKAEVPKPAVNQLQPSRLEQMRRTFETTKVQALKHGVSAPNLGPGVQQREDKSSSRPSHWHTRPAPGHTRSRIDLAHAVSDSKLPHRQVARRPRVRGEKSTTYVQEPEQLSPSGALLKLCDNDNDSDDSSLEEETSYRPRMASPEEHKFSAPRRAVHLRLPATRSDGNRSRTQFHEDEWSGSESETEEAPLQPMHLQLPIIS